MPNYTFDQDAFRYRGSDGRFVAGSTIRADLDTMLEGVQARTRTITTELIEGKLSLPDWQKSMAQEIKASHVASGILGAGGIESTSQADYGRMGHIIRDQYSALNQWSKDLESGKAVLDGRSLSRADMYQQHSRSCYEEVRRFAAKEAGLVFEISVLDPSAMHCNSCEDAAALGVQPTGVIEPIGSRECFSRCKCELHQFATREEAEAG